MALWQLDLADGIYPTDDRECKLLSGIGDHSRFVVVTAVLAVPSARAVADAFVAAMKSYEDLRDPGGGADRIFKQFAGRFTKPGRPRCCSSGVPRARHHRRADPAVLADRHPGRWNGDTRHCAASCSTFRPVRGPAQRAGGHRLGARL